jgi:hypothetical protein
VSLRGTCNSVLRRAYKRVTKCERCIVQLETSFAVRIAVAVVSLRQRGGTAWLAKRSAFVVRQSSLAMQTHGRRDRPASRPTCNCLRRS